MGGTEVLDVPADAVAPRRTGIDWRWLVVAGAVLVGIGIVVTVLLTSGGARGTSGASTADARSEALGADAHAALAVAIEQGEALAASMTADRLADPPAHSALLGALADGRAAGGGSASEAEAARGVLLEAIDRVTRSFNAKALADAQTDLSAIIATAVEVHAETAGRVADDGLRVELQARIDSGRILLSTAAAAVADVAGGAQAITDQTAAVLAARLLGFQQAQGRWCASSDDCIEIAWPTVTLATGDVIELAGGAETLGDSECFETDRFRAGRSDVAFLYCPAGAETPDGRRATGRAEGDESVDRLWLVDDGRLSDLRTRAT